MIFNIFQTTAQLAFYFNLSANAIQHQKFFRQRGVKNARKLKAERSKRKVHHQYSGNWPRAKLLEFIDDIRHLQKYKNDKLYLFALNLFGLILSLNLTTLYATLSIVRDPLTNEFKNPILKYGEMFLLVNFLSKSRRNYIFNQLVSLLLAQFLVTRVRYFFRQLNIARINRYCYKKINIIDINLSYVMRFGVNLSDWLKLSLNFNPDSCPLTRSVIRERRLALKRLQSETQKFSRFDLVYFHNAIDFDCCFEILEINMFKQKDKDYGSSDHDNHRFIPKMTHRLSPSELGVMIRVFVTATQGVVLIMLTGFSAYVDFGMSDQECTTFINCFLHLLQKPRLLFATVGGFAIILLICLNAFDNGLLAYYSMLCTSRTQRVLSMIRVESEFHSEHIDTFWLGANKVRENLWENVSTLDLLFGFDLPGSNTDNSQVRLFCHDISRVLKSSSSVKSNTGPPPRRYRPHFFGNLLEDKLYDYRNKRIGSVRMEEFNANIDYFIDLILVLQKELNDLKSFLTFQLNLNIAIGTLVTAIAFAILTNDINSAELRLTFALGFAGFFPMVYSLWMAATFEQCVSYEPPRMKLSLSPHKLTSAND